MAKRVSILNRQFWSNLTARAEFQRQCEKRAVIVVACDHVTSIRSLHDAVPETQGALGGIHSLPLHIAAGIELSDNGIFSVGAGVLEIAGPDVPSVGSPVQSVKQRVNSFPSGKLD